MRTLKFIVRGQIITKDETCNFNNLVPGSSGYLKAQFQFSKEWEGCVKVVEFTRNGKECTPQLLSNGVSCDIPAEVLTGRAFKIRVLGKNSKIKITTNRVEILQNGG